MELNPQEKSVLEKRNAAGDHFNYHHQSAVPSEWRFSGDLTTGPPTNLVCTERSMKGSGIENPPCSSVSMVNSFGQQSVWNSSHDHLINNEESMNCSTGYDLGWNPSSSGGNLPQSLVQFPADPAFIERAARFSSFGSGNFADIVNPFMVSESLLPYVKTGVRSLPQGPELLAGDMVQKNDMDVPRSGDASPVNVGIEQKIESMMRSSPSGSLEEGKERVGQLTNDVDLADGGDSGQGEMRTEDIAANEPAVKVVTAKRRRRGSQIDPNQVNPSQEATEVGNVTPDVKLKGEENQNAGSRKSSAKQSKENSQNSDSQKEDYIHIRARRGQATNSHSLAERVRREKISERMKFLQDLVPGCSKVTGKAVMLDEIINYVQSLQRQVEFLSMKLAAVNPRLDFSLDQLLAKEMLQLLNVPSSSVGFTPDISMTHPSLVHDHHQQAMVESNMQNLLNPSDQLRRMLSSHFTSGGYKEPAPQMLNVWNEEFQNAAQMPFVNSTSLQTPEESNSSLPHGHLKPEH